MKRNGLYSTMGSNIGLAGCRMSLKLTQDVEYETFFIPGCKMKIGRRDEDMLYSEGKIGDRMGVVRMVTQLKLIVIRPQGH